MTTTNNPLTFQPGKFYKTRDGRKARIYATDGSSSWPIHGAIFDNNSWLQSVFTGDGHFGMAREHPADLIAEWKDAPSVDWSKMPEGANFVTIDEDGTADAWEEKPYCRTSMWVSTFGDSWKLYPQHVPKWSGDWRESLVTRPTEETK